MQLVAKCDSSRVMNPAKYKSYNQYFSVPQSLRGYELDTFLKELLASLVGVVSAFILGSKIRLYFEIHKSLKINLLGLVQGASYI